MSDDGVLSTSGSSQTAQALATQMQVKVMKKEQDIEKETAAAELKLLDSLPTSDPRPDPSSPVGYNVNVKA